MFKSVIKMTSVVMFTFIFFGCGRMTQKEIIEQSNICFEKGMIPIINERTFTSTVYSVQCKPKEPVCVEYKIP